MVSLSGEVDPTSLVGGIPLNAGAAVKRLAVPTMLVVATNDRYTSVEETRAMYRAVKAHDKRLEVLSGPFDGLHGWQLLNNATVLGSPRSPAGSRRSSPPTPAADKALYRDPSGNRTPMPASVSPVGPSPLVSL